MAGAAGDGDGLGHLRRSIVGDDHVGRLYGRVAPERTHGDAHVAGGEGRCVVDTVAHKGHGVSFASEGLHMIGLAAGQEVAVSGRGTNGGGQTGGEGLAVAREYLGAAGGKGGEGLTGIGLGRVTQKDDPAVHAAMGHDDHRAIGLGYGCGHVDMTFVHEPERAGQPLAALHAVAGDVVQVGSCGGRDTLGGGVGGDSTGYGVVAAALQGGYGGEIVEGEPLGTGHGELARGERAGLVEGYGVDPAEAVDTVAALEEDAAA